MITKDPKNILVADDCLFFRTRLSHILIEAGHQVKIARNDRETIDIIANNSSWINLLTFDMQMPVITCPQSFDNLGVLEWINRNGFKGKFPILVITRTFESIHSIERLRNLGADGLITNASTPEQVIFRINQLLFSEKWKHGKPHKRVPVYLPVDFTLNNITHSGFLLNLSDTGTFLHTKMEFHIGARLKMQFSPPSLDKILNIVGTVQWLTQEKTDKNFFCGCGLEFNSISQEDQGVLENYVGAETKKLGLDKSLHAR